MIIVEVSEQLGLMTENYARLPSVRKARQRGVSWKIKVESTQIWADEVASTDPMGYFRWQIAEES